MLLKDDFALKMYLCIFVSIPFGKTKLTFKIIHVASIKKNISRVNNKKHNYFGHLMFSQRIQLQQRVSSN